MPALNTHFAQSLLNFYPVARVDLLSTSNDHRRCGSFLDVEDDQFANDLGRTPLSSCVRHA
jgi:hypothetical protein